MKEKIYTIPVNEAFEKQDGCPFCRLYRQLEKKEVDRILGAAMMEPDVRIQTNDAGFCGKHYRQMLHKQRRLQLGLILERSTPTRTKCRYHVGKTCCRSYANGKITKVGTAMLSLCAH